MTTSTIPSKARSRQSGFTLLELMVSGALSAMVMAGVFSSFLMVNRSGVNAINYCLMETQARKALEEFSQDVRMASTVTWNSANSITLTVPNNYTSTSGKVTYVYDSSTNPYSATKQSLYRMPGDSAASNPKTVLIRNIKEFSFSRYDRLDLPSTADTTTKRIQLSMKASISTQITATTSQYVLSSSYILRNKYAN